MDTFSIIIVILLILYFSSEPILLRKKLKKNISDLVTQNFDILFNNLSKAYYKNEYGYVDKNSIIKEVKRFVQIVIMNNVQAKRLISDLVNYKNLQWLFSSKTKRISKTRQKSNENDVEFYVCTLVADVFGAICIDKGVDINKPMKDTASSVQTGVDYEVFCENKLRDMGFTIQRTKIVGDQGVDLIAIKNDRKIAIQCKYYTNSVGNKAVQEIIAGANFYGCPEKAVITNSYFTKSAKQLAASLNVILVEYNNFNSLISIN